MSLDNYFGYLFNDSNFLKKYNVFWVQESLPGEIIQPFWIFVRTAE
jgi:hypothetical protein